MRNILRIMMIILLVVIGSIISIKNFKDVNKGYVVSDVEDKEKVYKEDTINKNKNNEQDNIQVNQISKSLNDKITIYISGEVKSPGVVELNCDDRLAEGVNLCGGLTNDANLNGINLAMRIQDEGHYIIPKIGDEIINNTIDTNIENNNGENITNDMNPSDNQNDNKDKININTATISELDSLPGFGEITAQKIIDYREENTKFNSIEEIKNIKGIGDKKFNDVKDYIYVQ